jgi:hypothetical protein
MYTSYTPNSTGGFMRYNLTLDDGLSEKLNKIASNCGISDLDFIRKTITERCFGGDLIHMKWKKQFYVLFKTSSGEHEIFCTVKTCKAFHGETIAESIESAIIVPDSLKGFFQEGLYENKYPRSTLAGSHQFYVSPLENENYLVHYYESWQNILHTTIDHIASHRAEKIFILDGRTLSYFFEEEK